MDNITVKDMVLDKKLDSYGYEHHNFLADGEISVTITLDEYRKLVKDCATAESRIKKAEEDRYERNQENESLKAENCDLKAELYELKKATESFDSGESHEEGSNEEWRSE